MNQAANWLYFFTALLGFLAAIVTAIRAIVRWGAGKGVLPLLLSLSCDGIALILWILAAAYGLSGGSLFLTWCFVLASILFTIFGFVTNPAPTVSRREVGLLCFGVVNASMFMITLLARDLEKTQKMISPLPAAISTPSTTSPK